MYVAVNSANPTSEKAKDQVVFTRHGDVDQLKTIWDSADLSGVTIISPGRNHTTTTRTESDG